MKNPGCRRCGGRGLQFRLPGGLLLQYAELLADLGEGGNASVEVLPLVAGGYLYADTGLVLRHYRIVEAGYEDTFVLQAGGHLLGQLGVVQHDCADSGLGGLDVEAAQIADSVGLMSKPAAFILLMK